MALVRDHFVDLERHRLQLENNVEKTQKALQHWRMADAEYEQLKEEIEALPANASDEDLDVVKAEFEGEVVTDKEVEELLGSGNISTSKIIRTLVHRIDYASKNVASLEKQLEVAESKLAAATIVTNPDVRDEGGLPITDIIEELDDEDNVTSFHLQQPGNMEPQIREALAKAGIKNLPETNQVAETQGEGSKMDTRIENLENESQAAPVQQPNQQETPTQSTENQNLEQEAQQSLVKKGVSFANDTKPGHDSDIDELQGKSRTAQRLEEIMEAAKEQAVPSENPVIPEDEPEDEAELRREMLRYGMTDIAPIVAELELDEDGGSEYEEFDTDMEDYDEDDDEDEHGRYKYRVVDDAYSQRMIELEKKLGIKSSRDLVKDEDEEDDDDDDEGIARIAIQPSVQPKSAMKTSGTTEAKSGGAVNPKKGVQFADSLDIAPDSTAQPVATSKEVQEKFVDPMKNTIVERSPAETPTTITTEPKKTSRFKKARTANPTQTLPIRQPPTFPQGPANAPARFLEHEDVQIAPSGPEGKTLASTLVERAASTEIKEPDEFDAALLNREATVEYHRMRNRMILKQGGFAKEEEEAIEYIDDEEEGSGRRVSRFKAARLAKR